MAVMERLKMFVVQEPVVAASCLIAGVGLFLPAVVRPILDSMETSKKVPQPALNDLDEESQLVQVASSLCLQGCPNVVAGMTGKKKA